MDNADAKNILSGIRIVGKRGREREPPHGIELRLVNPGIPGQISVGLRLPGREDLIELGLLAIKNQVIDVPLTLCFLCHAKEDEAAVAKIGGQLEGDGIVTWFSPKNLAGGASWKDDIDDAIRASDFVVIFLSPQSVNKAGYVQREVKRAFDRREELPDGERFIIPVLLEEFAPPKRYEDIQWIRLYEPDGYELLRQTLRDLSVP